MRAIYLQSVRSPAAAVGRGRFKLSYDYDARANVYSQRGRGVSEEEEDAYEEDSFCVDSSHLNQSGE